MQQCLYFLMMTSASLITDATMFIFFNDDFSLTNNVYIFNDGFSLTTTVGLAVCLYLYYWPLPYSLPQLGQLFVY